MTTLNISRAAHAIDLNRTAILIGIGAAIFVAQFLVVLSILDIVAPYNLQGMWITIPDFPARLNDTGSLLERVYSRLNGWDGHWYHHIAANGYRCDGLPENNNPYLCNVAFFPLLPMLGAALERLGIDLLYALPLISQVAWLATILLLLLFARSVAGLRPLHLLVLLALVAYPGALYGFVAYSEALLTLLIVAIVALTWWYLERPRAGVLAALAASCFLLGLVKVSGIIALAIPVLMALLHPGAGGRWFTRPQLLVYGASAAGIAGLAAFLVYCEWRFGDWALYFRYVGAAWAGEAAGPLRLNPLIVFSAFSWHEILALRISNLVAAGLPFVILALAIVASRCAGSRRHLAAALLFAIVALFYFYSTPGNGGFVVNMNIMRHMLPVVALLAMLAMALPLGRLERPWAYALGGALLALVAIEFFGQFLMFAEFRYGYWVS